MNTPATTVLNSPCAPRRALWSLALSASLSALLLMSPGAKAGPGAHGPNGEHLDAPASTLATSTLPRLEASTEAFELVAELRESELAIVVDRFETNEPVLNGTLEVESGSAKAVAVFRAEQGDYVVSDAAMLQALAQPGEHALVFTLMAGDDSDLLDGTLVAGGMGAAAGDDHAHGHGDHDLGNGYGLERAAWIGGGLIALGLIGGIAWWRQRSRSTGAQKEGL